jgi:hypothetical protein
MSIDPTPQVLPTNPSISHLKKQAKSLNKFHAAGEPGAVACVEQFHPEHPRVGELTLRDAQLTIAKQYGFDGWHDLNTAVGERMVEERDLHRWFGTQLNNGTWEVIAEGSVDPSSPIVDRENALYSAFASAYHWRMVGDEANMARGEHLISRVAIVVGEYEMALQHAERCREIVESHPSMMAEWDEPFAYEAIARANAALGNVDSAISALTVARDLTQSVSEAGDREVLVGELAREPWFGLHTQ